MPVNFAWIESDGGVVQPIGRIRPSLWLKAKGIGLPIEAAAFSRHRPVKEIAGIELETGLIGEKLHPSAGRAMQDSGGEPRCLGPAALEAKIVVVALRKTKLLVSVS